MHTSYPKDVYIFTKPAQIMQDFILATNSFTPPAFDNSHVGRVSTDSVPQATIALRACDPDTTNSTLPVARGGIGARYWILVALGEIWSW